MSKTILLITGANTGLGYEAIKALLQSSRPYEILLGCRSLSKGEAAISSLQQEVPSTSSTVTPIQVDVESDASIEAAYKTIESKHGYLDVLINNAGANFDVDQQNGKFSLREAFNKTWDVNVSGTHVLTHTFIPLLLKAHQTPPRIMFMASGTSSLANTLKFDSPAFARINASPEKGWPKPDLVNPVTMYRSAKTGMNMLVREWSRILKEDGVKVFAVSPGFLATGLAGIGKEKLLEMGAQEPYKGAEFMRDVAEGKWDEHDGVPIVSSGKQPF